MPPHSPAPGSPHDWLARARGKLAIAKVTLPPDAVLEDLCFFAQQAAELAIKAIYQQNGWKFAFVHDLGILLTGLSGHGLSIPPDVMEADDLSDYASHLRYPTASTPVTQTEFDEAVKIAEIVVTWAAAQIP